MSRLSQAPNRNLSLTEELERLEQSITLTLQEIDSNFSKAHRIVTGSILPVVEQYAQHSQDAWEGTKFWKQFFEASANVALSGYEEAALDEDVTQTETTTTHDSTFQTPTTHEDDDHDGTITGEEYDDQLEEEDYEEETSIIDSPSNATGVHSTPRLAGSAGKGRSREITSPSPARGSAFNQSYTRGLASPGDDVGTPVRNPMDLTSSSPFEPPSAFQPATAQRQNPDPIMHHRILDRNYRVQATPLTSRRKHANYAAAEQAETPGTTNQTQPTRTTSFMPDSSPMSSPEIPAPQLRSELFSPEKKSKSRLTPRTPGVSVQTPAKDITTSIGRSLFTDHQNNTKNATSRTLWDFDSDDDDDDLGASPPKTMQFHIPQSRLLQTPAREASKLIIDDLLATAGADRTDEIEGPDYDVPEMSPSVVRRKWDDDDTF
ncbi:hypothetical protein AAFC00_002251 [Neodothiora populina]|uniref:DASH complex subunit ASK1 n=1 Tax=Neodothiora populina TaxID=2781224 RepID=A0ABR3PGT9_9PEZI